MYKYGLIIFIFSLFNLNALDYEEISNEGYNGDRVIVYEFFYYGCRHCHNINNKMRIWLETGDYGEKIDYVRVPIIFNDLSELAAKHYFTAEILNVSDVFSANYYYEINKNNKVISDDLAYSILTKFSNKEVVSRNINSNIVKDRVSESKILMREYKITGTPTFIINGKYKTDGVLAKGNDRLISVIEELIEIELNNN